MQETQMQTCTVIKHDEKDLADTGFEMLPLSLTLS